MATAKSDFLDIELSPAGLLMAGASGAIRITNRHFNYQLKAGATARVLTSEWAKVLSKQLYQGQPIFKLASPTTMTADPQITSNTLKAQESVPEEQISQGAKPAAVKGGK
jgi:hypothetical protein